jgi:uncharacterized membrane protein
MLCAVLFLHEQPGVLAVWGAVLIGTGAFSPDGRSAQAAGIAQLPRDRLRPADRLHDRGVYGRGQDRGGGLPDSTADSGLGRQSWTSPPDDPARIAIAVGNRPDVAALEEVHIGIALLCPLSYILVLTAMVFTPVSYVAPAREISILIGALMGAHLLRKATSKRRLIAASAMMGGIVCLALG